MKNMFFFGFLCVLSVMLVSSMSAQALSNKNNTDKKKLKDPLSIGIGAVITHEFYQRMQNSIDGIASRSSGSAMLNLGIGPKIWLGKKDFGVSVETKAVLSPLGFAIQDNKGFGIVHFPILFKANFKGLTTNNPNSKWGWSLGVGQEYFRTEVFGLKEKYKNLGINRKIQKVYIVEIGVGFGTISYNMNGFVRYGRNFDTKANAFHLGVNYEFNLTKLHQLKKSKYVL